MYCGGSTRHGFVSGGFNPKAWNFKKTQLTAEVFWIFFLHRLQVFHHGILLVHHKPTFKSGVEYFNEFFRFSFLWWSLFLADAANDKSTKLIMMKIILIKPNWIFLMINYLCFFRFIYKKIRKSFVVVIFETVESGLRCWLSVTRYLHGCQQVGVEVGLSIPLIPTFDRCLVLSIPFGNLQYCTYTLILIQFNDNKFKTSLSKAGHGSAYLTHNLVEVVS